MEDKYKFKYDNEKQEFTLSLYGYDMLIRNDHPKKLSNSWTGWLSKKGVEIFKVPNADIATTQYLLRNKLFEMMRENRKK